MGQCQGVGAGGEGECWGDAQHISVPLFWTSGVHCTSSIAWGARFLSPVVCTSLSLPCPALLWQGFAQQPGPLGVQNRQSQQKQTPGLWLRRVSRMECHS